MCLEFNFNLKQHMIIAETSILFDKEYKLECWLMIVFTVFGVVHVLELC